jgi:hypothetical protein
MMGNDLLESVNEIYQTARKPLYLSKLGEILRKKYDIYRENLYDAVDSLPGYKIVSEEGKKERAAIASHSDADDIYSLLNEQRDTAKSTDIKFLTSLHRSILIAFCSKRRASSNFYIQKRLPFHCDAMKINEDDLEIQNDYLIDIFLPFDLAKVSSGDAELLRKNITSWSTANSVDLDMFKKSNARVTERQTLSLLEQVIAAIPANKRHGLNMSLDIVEILMNKG